MSSDHVAGTPAAEPRPTDGSAHYAGAAAGAAAWAFVFLILRIFAVSGYQWDTAFAVSTTLGLDDGLGLVFGTLMSGHILAGVLLILVLPLLAAAYLWGPRNHRPVVVLASTLGVVTLLALTVTYRSWWLPIVTAAVLGVFALIHRMPPGWPLRRAAMAAMGRVGWVAGIGVLLVAAFTPTPWVPHEQIETTDGTVSGYVLSVDSGYLNVLTDDHRFTILISGDVISRQ